jgi:hypothetical protein
MGKLAFKVEYQALRQFEGLSSREQSQLRQMLTQAEPPADTREVTVGRFLTSLGDRRRVLWRKASDGDAVVLSIVEHGHFA